MTNSNIAQTIRYSLLLAILLASFNRSVSAQNTGTEVPLTFQFEGIISSYISSIYKDDEFLLAGSEILSVTDIPYEIDQGALTIRGELNGEVFVIDLRTQVAAYKEIRIQLQADDFLINELDYFLHPSVFKELLELDFTVDFNNLRLSLEVPYEIPRVAQFRREQKRNKLDRAEVQTRRAQYPILYDRKPEILDGAFLDYNINGIVTSNSSLLTMNNTIGTELLGGDLQGSLFSVFNSNEFRTQSNNLRLRYVSRNTPYFTTALIGQSSSQGFVNRQITGLQISDRPIEPRLLFDRYIVDGEAPPQSEVELYLNNRLIDYQQSNEVGYYRFVVPLTYGNTDYQVRIYTPSGRSIERSRRIQIPFNYLPPGEIDYNISFGRLDNPLIGSSNQDYQASATVGAGVNNWLSVQGSTEYLSEYHDGKAPAVTGTVNARLLNQYLVSLSANSESVLQLNSNVVFSSGANFNFSHSRYGQENSIYNLAGIDNNTSLSVFTPLPIKLFPLNIRVTGSYQEDRNNTRFRYRTDLNSRLGRINVRLGYSDQQVGSVNFDQTLQSRLFTSLTYSLRRSRDLPNYIRGAFLRGQISYLPGLGQFEETGIQISKEVLRTGRLQFGINRNFVGSFTSLTLTMNIDFRNFRTNSSVVTGGGNYTINQGIQGSAVYDPYNKNVFLSNREQVGQAGLGVRLYVDNDNNGSYDKETDQIIEDEAVRLSFAGERNQIKNGVNYIGQLLPYFQYDVEINKGALKNPLLVPELEKFSIVTDPNQYKPLEIPFYMSGVVSGSVNLYEQDRSRGIGGVRLYLQKTNADSTTEIKEIPTFSDGSFYTYEVPPGEYNMFVDPNQLDFLNAVSYPDTLKFEVRALSEGDFIEGLIFDLYKDGLQPDRKDSLITENIEKDVTTVDFTSTNPKIDSSMVSMDLVNSINPLNPLPAYYVPSVPSISEKDIMDRQDQFTLETYFASTAALDNIINEPIEMDFTPIPIDDPGVAILPINIEGARSDSATADSVITDIGTDPEQEVKIDTPDMVVPPVIPIDNTGLTDQNESDTLRASDPTGTEAPADSSGFENPESEEALTESVPLIFPVIPVNLAGPDSVVPDVNIPQDLPEEGFPVPTDTISVGDGGQDPTDSPENPDDYIPDYPERNVSLIQLTDPVLYYTSASDEYFLDKSTDSISINGGYAVVELTNRRFDASPIERDPEDILSFQLRIDSLLSERKQQFAVTKDPTPESSIPDSTVEMVISTVETCSYGLQLLSYRSLEATTRYAAKLEAPSKHIIYNINTDLYALRAGRFPSLSRASAVVERYSSEDLYDVSVLIKCHTDRDEVFMEPGFDYSVQIGGAYEDLYKARSESIELNDTYDLTTYVRANTDSTLFTLRAADYNSSEEARLKTQELSDETGLKTIATIDEPFPAEELDLRFRYRLNVGSSDNRTEAIQFAQRFSADVGVDTRILLDEDRNYLIITDENITSWRSLLRLRDRIQNTGYSSPVIHLQEYR